MYSFSAIPLNNGDFKLYIWFQPICGTFTFGVNFTTSTLKIPKPIVLPSCDLLHINCIPKQIPKTGCFKVGISTSSPLSTSILMAELASPTPGKIILSAAFISFQSLLSTALKPNLSIANMML